MNHKELLQKINEMEYADYKGIGAIPDWPYKIIRAVVELHKPISVIIGDSNGNIHTKFSKWQCKGCHGEYNHFNGVYPCPTIQAIEKELQ